MQLLIDKMRSDFKLVAKKRRELGDWSEEDEADIGGAVKAAIDRKDRDLILCWSRWLADLAAWCVAYQMIAAGAEQRIRNQVALEKAAAKEEA
ncbi:MAG: hypothetical protein H6R18_1924 [Proteobacteria bacterium]|nr:hypothetical protein [Pseudomonadota bacterium]